jgi:hypothetical protein
MVDRIQTGAAKRRSLDAEGEIEDRITKEEMICEYYTISSAISMSMTLKEHKHCTAHEHLISITKPCCRQQRHERSVNHNVAKIPGTSKHSDSAPKKEHHPKCRTTDSN